MVAGATLERAQRVEMNMRRSSDAQLELARDVYELQKLGDWRDRYATFVDYAFKELKLPPGRTHELLRMQRKLEWSEVDSATASEIGWDKLRLVPLKTLQCDDRAAVLEELASENVLVLRDKYCPRTARPTPRQTCCSETPAPCGERHAPPAACTVSPETAAAPVQEGPAAATGVNGSGPSLGRVDPAKGAVANDETLFDGRPLVLTDLIAVALRIARREMGPCDDRTALKGVCAAFIAYMGTESEMRWVRSVLEAEQEKTRAAMQAAHAQKCTPQATAQRSEQQRERSNC